MLLGLFIRLTYTIITTLFLQEEHPACKNWVMGCWGGYLSGARCRLFAYNPVDATAIPKPHHLFLHLNPDWFYLSGCPGKEAVKGCSVAAAAAVYSSSHSTMNVALCCRVYQTSNFVILKFYSNVYFSDTEACQGLDLFPIWCDVNVMWLQPVDISVRCGV